MQGAGKWCEIASTRSIAGADQADRLCSGKGGCELDPGEYVHATDVTGGDRLHSQKAHREDWGRKQSSMSQAVRSA